MAILFSKGYRVHIGVTTVRDETYHLNFRLKQAAKARGHSLVLINPYRCLPGIDSETLKLFRADDTRFPLPDVVIPRQGSLIGTFSLTLTSHFEALKIPLVNGIQSIILASNQFSTLQHLAASGVAVPDSFFISSLDAAQTAVNRLGGYPAIAKKINGRQGEGVFLLECENDAKKVAEAILENGAGMLVQRFVPVKGRRDIRVLVIGEKCAGAMALVPPGDEFRANYHLNSSAVTVTLSREMKQIAVKAAKAVGLDIAGVDMMVDQNGNIMVVEVNYSPGFKGLEKTTRLDIADRIINHSLDLAVKKRL